MSKKNQRKELGKGLRALLSTMDEDLQTEEQQEEVVKTLASNIVEIPVNQIEENPFQPRTDFDEEALDELAQSISVHGLIQPITVRRLSERKYQLISGERRWRATQKAGIEQIPAYVRLANDQEMLEMALVENIQREQLNPIEVAISYQRLMQECELSHEALSERVGKKRSTITNYVRLLKLPPQIQNTLKNKKISMGHARALAGLENIEVQLDALHEVLDKKLNVRQTEQLLQRLQHGIDKVAITKSELPHEYLRVQDQFSNILGSRVRLKVNAKGKGNINIPFDSTEELNRILEIFES
jgi:ParB family chromosome partitioning protein